MYSTTFDMSRGIVSQRPFTRKKRNQSVKKVLNKSWISVPDFKISEKLKSILSRWLIFTLLTILGVVILVKLLFFQRWQTISQIKISDSTLATYQNPYLFDFIASEVKWKNYYLINADKDELLAKIQKGFNIKNLSWEAVEFKFPFVWNIELQLEPQQEMEYSEPERISIWIDFPFNIEWTWFHVIKADFPLRMGYVHDEWWTLGVELDYYEPSVLVKLNNKEFAVWNEMTYVEMKEWMLLWIRDQWEEPLFLIDTPSYLSWADNLDWFFFEVSLEKFLKIISLAKEEFWNNMVRFVYLAWSTRFAIFTSDDKTLYFNFPDWIDVQQQRNSQINKYRILRERYPKFDKIEKIDLWALEENKTIITNY